MARILASEDQTLASKSQDGSKMNILKALDQMSQERNRPVTYGKPPEYGQPVASQQALSTILAHCARVHRERGMTWDTAWIVVDSVTWDFNLNPTSKRQVALAAQAALLRRGILHPTRNKQVTLVGNARRDYSTWGKRFREMLNHKRTPRPVERVTKSKREHYEELALEELNRDLERM